ncbi:protein LEKR1 isoform X2 [Anolis carolinensis]|nr:PREDICTED: leucine-, glutamate- and lysine-rich protein 1 isoform X2 [Anolis carolinensis]XP_008104329.1 PREDICTED: leucine-, glutamate- and lysine-rich protein 1 isoform X2 [Anolis carolinensis]|eukprot:XP_008104328.1 PREDICTED: leucine-, glutamate- and lysine-rich protein 1 isoform X2 [Anolis carolinensis]
MSRDQTVCKYCGISYLILHEFKLLEEKLKVMEEKVKFYERNVEREKILQEKLQCLSQDFEQCTAASKSKTERIKSLSLEIENKHAALQNLSEQLRGLQKEKEISHRQSELLRKALEQRMFIIRKAFVLLPFIREEINSIKEKIFGFSRQWVALKEDIFLHLKSMNVTALEELSSANQSLGECQRENLILEEEVQRLRLVSEAAKQEGEQLQTSLLRESELQNKCHELQKKTQDLTSQIKTIESQLQKSAAEVHHYKELFIKKSKEVEYHQSELQKMAYEVGMSESRFNHALTEREQSLLGCQQACCRLQEEMIEKERKEEDLKKLTKHLESELEAIKNLLKQREEEVVTLKQERASVLISHQTRTEQLQETLRQKVLSEKSWQEKIEAERAKEQVHHKEEVLRLKEDAKMELDIEKQKHQEIVAKYQKDQNELLHTKIPLLISSATYNLKMEMDALEKKLHESQAMLTEKNQEREKEWQNLKKQIMELEHQLQKEQSTHHSVTANMKEEIKKKTHELEKLTQEQTQLIQNMNQVQEENALLQDTVRRECEERYELTEALAQAREQVVDLKKLGGNFPLSQCSLSQGSLTSSTRLVSNHGQKNPSCGKGVRLLGLCGISKATDAPVYSARYKSTSHVSLPALPPLQPPGRRTSSSLDESRKKRITAVIKRQLSEL